MRLSHGVNTMKTLNRSSISKGMFLGDDLSACSSKVEVELPLFLWQKIRSELFDLDHNGLDPNRLM